jgi:hypothetical protein
VRRAVELLQRRLGDAAPLHLGLEGAAAAQQRHRE